MRAHRVRRLSRRHRQRTEAEADRRRWQRERRQSSNRSFARIQTLVSRSRQSTERRSLFIMGDEVEGVDFFTSDLIRRTRARKQRLEREIGHSLPTDRAMSDRGASDMAFDVS